MIGSLSGEERRLFVVVSLLRQVMRGRSNAAGAVLLDPGTTTDVPFDNCTADSVPVLSPRDAEAAAAGAFVSAVRAKGFTITHSAGGAGRQMGFGIIG